MPKVFMKFTGAVVSLSFLLGGCTGVSPSSHMPTLLEQETNPNGVIQEKLSEARQPKLQVGLALVPDIEKSHPPVTLSEDSFARFTARTKNELENKVPVRIQEVVRLEELQPGKSIEQLKRLGKTQKLEFVLLVLTSSEEVQNPAYLDASSPDVGVLPGNEIENYALVEIALVDLQSGKSLIQAHGRS